MAIFVEIADQWKIADDAFSAIEQHAFSANDDARFDAASEQRKRNDQAYFLYLFTRFEEEVNKALSVIVDNRVRGITWADRRIWEAWSRGRPQDIFFMSRVEVLVDKSLNEYATIKSYYGGRNSVAHGDTWGEQFFIPDIARNMRRICASFPTT
jgi:hypothetical protein